MSRWARVSALHLPMLIDTPGLQYKFVNFRVQDSGCRVQGSGFRVQGSGFRVQGSGFRAQGSELHHGNALILEDLHVIDRNLVQGLRFRVEG